MTTRSSATPDGPAPITAAFRLYDISADYALSKQVSCTAYYGHSFGKTVVAAIYPRDREAQFGYFELDYRLSHPLRGNAP